MKMRLGKALSKANQLMQAMNPNPLLPGIIGCLEAMRDAQLQHGQIKIKLAGGLGRLVMEDMALAESPFGLELLSLADDYAKEEEEGPSVEP